MATASGNGAAAPSSALPLSPSNSAAQSGPSAAAATGGSGNGSAIDAASLKYRVPMAPSLDGNTVDEQLEQSAFAENSVRYQATLTLLNSALRNLMTAITGS